MSDFDIIYLIKVFQECRAEVNKKYPSEELLDEYFENLTFENSLNALGHSDDTKLAFSAIQAKSKIDTFVFIYALNRLKKEGFFNLK